MNWTGDKDLIEAGYFYNSGTISSSTHNCIFPLLPWSIYWTLLCGRYSQPSAYTLYLSMSYSSHLSYMFLAVSSMFLFPVVFDGFPSGSSAI